LLVRAPSEMKPSADLDELARALAAMGCPAEKSAAMAAHLDKRARQLATQKGRTYEQALTHLLGLMRQGWAATEKFGHGE
jgi:hypothetical protein